MRSRAISFLDEFTKEDGCFKAFVDFVREHDELELLFRGNSGKHGEVTIYYKNNIVWRLSKNSRNATVTINYNHLRYCEDWKTKMRRFNAYGFPIKYPVVQTKKNGRKSYDSQYVSVKRDIKKNEIFDMEFVAGTYEIIKEVMADYFYCDYENAGGENASKLINHFREYLGGSDIDLPQKPNYCEKEKQQRYFSCNYYLKNGVFVYDLEYKEPYKNKEEKAKSLAEKNRKKMNKPDCLGIRFDENGKPIKFVMIEIKSKASAEFGESGTKEHLEGMIADLKDEDFVKSRLIEAKEIMEQYQMLRLRGLDEKCVIPDFLELIDKLGTEILVVYTDELANSKVIGTNNYGEIEYKVEIFKG